MNVNMNAADPPEIPADEEGTSLVQSEPRAPLVKDNPRVPILHKEKAIKVLIADDHPFVRKGIKQCINDNPDMKVVGESGTALGVFEFLSREKCDILILDIGLPDQTGLEVLRILRKTHPALPVLILSMYPQAEFSKHCLEAGAAGFISKSNATTQLVGAIRQVTGGSRYIAPLTDDKSTPQKCDDPVLSRHKALSAREFHIFCQIVAGQPLKLIASELGVGVSTISRQRASILKKMGMTSNQDIVEYAQTHQLCS